MRQRSTKPEQRGKFTRVSPRERYARRRREHRRQRLAIIAGIIIVLAIIAIPAYGYYASFVAPPRHMVARVNQTTYTLGELAHLTQVYMVSSQQVGVDFNLASGPFQVLKDLVENELVRQNASKLGISVFSEEVDLEVRVRFYPTPPEGQQVSQDQLEREYQEQLRRFLTVTNLSLDQYKDTVRTQLFRIKAREKLSVSVPRVAEQVYVHWVRVADQTQANQVQERLKKGDEFALVAQEMNTDTSYANEQGEVGWVPRRAFLELDETLFKLEHGKVSDPVFAEGGVYFIKVTAGPEAREVSQKMLDRLELDALNTWITEQYQSNDVNVSFNSDNYEWLVKQVRQAVPQQTPQAGQGT